MALYRPDLAKSSPTGISDLLGVLSMGRQSIASIVADVPLGFAKFDPDLLGLPILVCASNAALNDCRYLFSSYCIHGQRYENKLVDFK
jgi:hypothetical protein